MNKLQLLKCKKLWHSWSETVISFDLRKMPAYIKANISKSEYDLSLQLPIIRVDEGLLLVNESFPDWEMVKTLLVALDTLPREMLKDIYVAERKRYSDSESAAILESDSVSEKARKIIFMFCPELLAAQSRKHM